MPEYKSKLERINAELLKEEGVQFQYEPKEGQINYISNTVRADMLAAMKEFISRNEFGDVDNKTKN